MAGSVASFYEGAIASRSMQPTHAQTAAPSYHNLLRTRQLYEAQGGMKHQSSHDLIVIEPLGNSAASIGNSQRQHRWLQIILAQHALQLRRREGAALARNGNQRGLEDIGAIAAAP